MDVPGRQDHGWFGHGTGPGAPSPIPDAAQSAAVLDQRIRDIAHTLIAGLPASKRYHDAARLSEDDRARLTRLLTGAVQALPLGLPGIARRVFGKNPDTPGVDGFAQAAGLLRDGRDNADLRAATDALGKAAQDIGLDRFKSFLREADEHLAERGGLAVLVRDMPAPAPPSTKTPFRIPAPPAPGRIPWGSLAAGVAIAGLPAMSDLVQRENVRDTIERFGLDVAKPADVTAAYAFLWAQNHGPWLFDTPQTGPAMLAMAERVMRAARTDPDLFGRAVGGDEAAQKQFSAVITGPPPGSGIETRNDDERDLAAQMQRAGKNSTEIESALAEKRKAGGNLAQPGDATLGEDRRKYILHGNGRGGGGHGPGHTTPDKTTFPSDWSDEKTIEAIKSIANDPASVREPAKGERTAVRGTQDGVYIEVIIGRDRKAIVTAYPVKAGSEKE